MGSNLAVRLKRDNPGGRIIALDNLKRRGSELNIYRLKEAGVEFIHGDIRNKEDLEAAGHFDLLLECSAEPSVLAGYDESPEYLINTNLSGTINCLEAVRQFKAEIIFLSTSRVYPLKIINGLKYTELDTRFELKPEQKTNGASSNGISEEFPLGGIRSLYGATKLASELMIQEYIDMYDMRGIINRCGVLTGPWQMGKVDQGFVVLWMARHIFKGELSYIGYGGKGKQVRDILHVDDLYNLIKLQINDLKRYNGEIFNVGGGKDLSISLCELTRLCQDITGTTIDIASEKENRKGDIPCYVTDCSKVRKATGWEPHKATQIILEEIYSWIMENKKTLGYILS